MFIKENLNPFGIRTVDCVTRSIAKATGLTYDNVLDIQYKYAKKTKRAFNSNEVIGMILSEYGFNERKFDVGRNGWTLDGKHVIVRNC